MPQQVTDRLAPVQPRLYLAKAPGGSQTPRKMGVASGLVQPKDILLWVRSSRRALLARVFRDSSLPKARIFGTALVTEDVCDLASDIDYEQRWNSRQNTISSTAEIYIDAGTVFML
ncbi:hypothetical protein V8C35DRAFT_298438 [Trichoderma chlorosporum]